ncbi:TolC family protein [Gemmatimonadota bacterium]
MKRPFPLTLVCLIPALLIWASPLLAQGTGSGPSRTLTLEAAIELAESQNPTLRAGRQQIYSAEGAVIGARGAMLPTASFSTLWNFAEKVQVIPNPFKDFALPGGPPPSDNLELDFTQDFQGSMSLDMPLAMWGLTRNGYADARTALDMTKNSHESSRLDVVLQVTQAFYGVLLAEEGLRVAQDALAQAERQEAIAAERLAQGAASEFDILRAKVQVANLKPGVTRAESMIRQVRIGLNLLLGLPSEEEIRLEGELRYMQVNFTFDELRQRALANRVDLQNARLGIQRAELGVKMASASRLPVLMLNGSFSFRSNDALLSDNYNDSYMANLILAFPIFDGFAAKSRKQMASAGREQARIMVDQFEQVIDAEIEQALNDLQAAEQTYLAQVDNVAIAERALQIAQISFENEMMTSVELMDSQLALTMARQNHYQSLYDYLIALARIEKAVGQPITF